MDKLSQELKQKIVDALKEKEALKSCPRCGNNNFDLIDGIFMHPIQSKIGEFALGGQGVPVAVINCTKCGYLCEHALGTLGLMEEFRKKNSEQPSVPEIENKEAQK